MIIDAKVRKTAILTAVFFSITLISFSPLNSQTLTGLDQDISRVVDKVSKGVVTIEARPPESRVPVYPGQELNQFNAVKAVVGSGLLLDSLGHILTILGLVDGFDDFRVVIDGYNKTARLIGIDERFNLAVLKIDSNFTDYLEISPAPPLVGRLAIGFGHAIGRTGFPTLGIIAGRRSDGSYLMSGYALPGLLRGGVFDLSGLLIGVIISGSVMDGHHVNDLLGGMVLLPASTAYAAADRIICCGDREAGYLGVKTAAIELISADGRVLGEGVVVSNVDPGSPAASVGIRMGDIITRFGARQVTNDLELQRLVASSGSGNLVEIEYIRDRKTYRKEINLAKFSAGRGAARQYRTQTDISPEVNASRLQKQIDSLRYELSRIQKELDALLQRVDLSR